MVILRSNGAIGGGAVGNPTTIPTHVSENPMAARIDISAIADGINEEGSGSGALGLFMRCATISQQIITKPPQRLQRLLLCVWLPQVLFRYVGLPRIPYTCRLSFLLLSFSMGYLT